MRKFCLFVTFIILSVSIGNVAHATLDPKFRRQFSKAVENLCASTIEYDLGKIDSKKTFEERERELVENTTKYHGTVNCLLNRAMEGRIKSTNREVEEFFGRKLKHVDFDFKKFKEPSEQCRKKIISRTLRKQQQLRLKYTEEFPFSTACAPNDFPGGNDVYSSCRISEMLLSELCGYQHYLEAKRADDPTLLARVTGGKYENFGENIARIEKFLDKEKIRSRKTLLNALLFYRQFEQNYRRHAWLIALKEGFEEVSVDASFFRDKIFNTFPYKFPDHSK